jgi:hypothetical protein
LVGFDPDNAIGKQRQRPTSTTFMLLYAMCYFFFDKVEAFFVCSVPWYLFCKAYVLYKWFQDRI